MRHQHTVSSATSVAFKRRRFPRAPGRGDYGLAQRLAKLVIFPVNEKLVNGSSLRSHCVVRCAVEWGKEYMKTVTLVHVGRLDFFSP